MLEGIKHAASLVSFPVSCSFVVEMTVSFLNQALKALQTFQWQCQGFVTSFTHFWIYVFVIDSENILGQIHICKQYQEGVCWYSPHLFSLILKSSARHLGAVR